VIPLYRELVDVIDGAFVIKQINSGIQGDFQPPANTELIEFAQKDEEKSGLSVPFGYAPSVSTESSLKMTFGRISSVMNGHRMKGPGPEVALLFVQFCVRI